MDGYVIVNLKDMVDQVGENETKTILSTFSCPLNRDVEMFIKSKAIVFAMQDIAPTQLVFMPFQGQPVLVGYFTLANKIILIPTNNVTKSLGRRLSKFSQDRSRLPSSKNYMIPAPLIGQLGKNFTNGYNKLISGDVLLKLALDRVRSAQRLCGGKVVYLECEDKPYLIRFYESNGFVSFGKRQLDRDERDFQCGNYLIQMLKYLAD